MQSNETMTIHREDGTQYYLTVWRFDGNDGTTFQVEVERPDKDFSNRYAEGFATFDEAVQQGMAFVLDTKFYDDCPPNDVMGRSRYEELVEAIHEFVAKDCADALDFLEALKFEYPRSGGWWKHQDMLASEKGEQ